MLHGEDTCVELVRVIPRHSHYCTALIKVALAASHEQADTIITVLSVEFGPQIAG